MRFYENSNDKPFKLDLLIVTRLDLNKARDVLFKSDEMNLNSLLELNKWVELVINKDVWLNDFYPEL